jgi:hypothetical protein
MKLNYVDREVYSQSWVELRNHVYKQVGPKVIDQVRAYVEDPVMQKVFNQIWYQVRFEVKEKSSLGGNPQNNA